jgi:hypothetical protein
LIGIVAAASTFDSHLLDSPIVILLMPGLLTATVVSGNIHAWQVWIAASGNFLFYFFLTWLVDAIWIRVRTKA